MSGLIRRPVQPPQFEFCAGNFLPCCAFRISSARNRPGFEAAFGAPPGCADIPIPPLCPMIVPAPARKSLATLNSPYNTKAADNTTTMPLTKSARTRMTNKCNSPKRNLRPIVKVFEVRDPAARQTARRPARPAAPSGQPRTTKRK